MSTNTLPPSQQWVPSPIFVPLKRPAGTPQAANLSEALFAGNKELGTAANSDFIVMAQGNHDPVYARMSAELSDMFTRTSRTNPVYKKTVTPVELAASVAGFERRFFGVNATTENSFCIKQQGRFLDGVGMLALDAYHDRPQKAVVPNLRWRVLDIHYKAAHFQTVDYDVTATDVAASIRQSVENAGGPLEVGMVYICSPNNPTGRRFTESEYRGIRQVVDGVNQARAAAGLKKTVIVCDDPYFPANYINHRNTVAAESGTPYQQNGYRGLTENPDTPVLYMHSFSKFAEMAGGEGTSLAVCTSPELTAILHTYYTAFGGLAYADGYAEGLQQILAPENDQNLLDRCIQEANLFYQNKQILDDAFGDKVLPSQPNMVACVRVAKEGYVGRIVQYPSGKEVELKGIDDVVEMLANMYGVGLVPEKNERKVETQAYDAESEDIIRFALNNNPLRTREGISRAIDALRDLSALQPGQKLTPDIAQRSIERARATTFGRVQPNHVEHLLGVHGEENDGPKTQFARAHAAAPANGNRRHEVASPLRAEAWTGAHPAVPAHG